MRAKLWLVLFLLLSATVEGKEFSEEFEKNYPLRSIARLHIRNAKGDITVQGWAHDKIRIRIKKLADVESMEMAKPLLDGTDFRYIVSDENIEISNQYGSGLSIEDRLKERENKATRIDMMIFAPSKLDLRV